MEKLINQSELVDDLNQAKILSDNLVKIHFCLSNIVWHIRRNTGLNRTCCT